MRGHRAGAEGQARSPAHALCPVKSVLLTAPLCNPLQKQLLWSGYPHVPLRVPCTG